jgi:hypothetical protein
MGPENGQIGAQRNSATERRIQATYGRLVPGFRLGMDIARVTVQ